MANNQQYVNKRDAAENGAKALLEKFKAEWVTVGPDKACVEFCDELANIFASQQLSSTFIRNIYGEMVRIQAGGFDNHTADFYLLRPKVAYAVKRSDKDYIAKYYSQLYNKMADVVTTATHYENLVKIAEAIIAYHKTYYDK